MLLLFEEFISDTLVRGEIYTIVVTFYIGGISYLFQRNASTFEEFLNYLRGKKCRILIFGAGGSGKTSIIDNALYDGKNKQIDPTSVAYEFHEGIVKLEKNGVNIPVMIADYIGQYPS